MKDVGLPLGQGDFCKACKDRLAKGFESLYPQKNSDKKSADPKDSARMRYLDQK